MELLGDQLKPRSIEGGASEMPKASKLVAGASSVATPPVSVRKIPDPGRDGSNASNPSYLHDMITSMKSLGAVIPSTSPPAQALSA